MKCLDRIRLCQFTPNDCNVSSDDLENARETRRNEKCVTFIDMSLENRTCLIQGRSHAKMLTALAGKHEDDLPRVACNMHCRCLAKSFDELLFVFRNESHPVWLNLSPGG